MIESVRVTQQAKDQLLTLKRRTGVMQWNVLCRWALCRSLAEPTSPARVELQLNSNIEMDWRTFGGPEEEIYLALVRWRCAQDGLDHDDATVLQQFKLHLHRGIGYLAGDKSLQSVEDLIGLGAAAS